MLGANITLLNSTTFSNKWYLSDAFKANTATETGVKPSAILDFENNRYALKITRTNKLSNSEGTGTTVSSNTLPTGWSLVGATGLSTTIQNIGTDSFGHQFIDVRINGTASATSMRLNFCPTNQIGGYIDDWWSTSVYVSLVSGSLTNITSSNISVFGITSGGTTIETTNTVITLNSSHTKVSTTRQMTSATTAFVSTGLYLTNNTGAIDFTLRISQPQLENTGIPSTSYIPTTSGEVSIVDGMKSFNLSDMYVFLRGSGSKTYLDKDGIVKTISTNNVPAFSYLYDAATGTYTSEGISLDAGATNLQQYSEDFTNATYWSTKSGVVVTIPGNITDPFGGTETNLFTETADSGFHYVRSSTKTITAGAYVTISVYCKKFNTRDKIVLLGSNPADTKKLGVIFDMTAKTFTATSVTGSWIVYDNGYREFPNGFFRVYVTLLTNTDTSFVSSIGVANANTSSGHNYTGSVSEGMYFIGAQVEAVTSLSGGAPFSSYIKTTTAAVTRASEYIQLGKFYNVFWNNTASTLIIKYRTNNKSGTASLGIHKYRGTWNEGFTFITSGSSAQVFRTVGGSTEYGPTKSGLTYSSPAIRKYCAVMANNDVGVTVDGLSLTLDNTAPLPDIPNELYIGRTSGSYLTGRIEQIIYYPYRLTDAELQRMTTL